MIFTKPNSISITIDDRLSHSRVSNNKILRLFFAEFFGTGILVLIGCGTCVSTSKVPENLITTALCFGLVVCCLASALGGVSGAHLNPAVTIGLLINGKIDFCKSLLYILAQFFGSIAGTGILALILANGNNVCPTTLSSDISAEKGIGIELVITFMLVLVVCCCCHSNTPLAPVAIGFAVIVGHLFAIPLTSASMNPARSFGPALVSFTWTNHHVYWIGPLLGGALAGLTHKIIFQNNDNNIDNTNSDNNNNNNEQEKY